MRRLGPALIASVALVACSTYQDHLNRSQRYYDENEYENALAVLRVMEPDVDSLSWPDRARYAYVRGMTDYRLGYRSHARYWLGISQAIESQHPPALNEQSKARAQEALSDLNRDVYGGDAPPAEASPAVAEDGTSAPASTAVPPASDTQQEPQPDGAQRACRQDTDCSAEELCIRGGCIEP